jgi:hypothetical protein
LRGGGGGREVDASNVELGVEGDDKHEIEEVLSEVSEVLKFVIVEEVA